MNTIKQQINLFKKRSQIRTEMHPITFDGYARNYIKKLIRTYKKNILSLFGIVLLISVIEIVIPLVVNVFLERFGFNLQLQNLYIILSVLVLILILYITANYFAIGIQKRISLDIINQIREDWLKVYLTKNPVRFNNRDKGSIYVKISYHLSLLQMGLNNSLFNFFQWGLFMSGLLAVTAVLDTRLFVISLFFIPLNLIVLFISYVLSAHYLAKDQTLYSKLLRYISDTFNNFQLIKALKKENEFLKNVKHIVELDNYFRIKREIVLNLGNKIIFVVVTLLSAAMYLIYLYFPFISLDTTVASVIQVLIFALHLKLIYLSLRIGLFYFPLKLGLYLCVPHAINKKSKKISNISSLKFHAKKVRLHNQGEYVKNLSFQFENSKSYLFHDGSHTSNNLEYLFPGMAPKSIGRNWVVTVNDKRLTYNQWNKSDKSIYMINPSIESEVSLYEFFNNTFDIEVLKDFSIFDFIFEKKKFLGEILTSERTSFTDVCLLQIAYCLIHQPEIIIIDASVVDINYPKIRQALDILNSQSRGIIISFSYLEKPPQNYDVIYTI